MYVGNALFIKINVLWLSNFIQCIPSNLWIKNDMAMCKEKQLLPRKDKVGATLSSSKCL